MKTSNTKYLFIFVLLYLVVNCDTAPYEIEEPEINPQFDITGSYSNPYGNAPHFKMNNDSIISFKGMPEVIHNSVNHSVSITLDMISISKDNMNYHIDSIYVQEYVNNNWINYPEFSIESPIELTKIAVVLLLDCSSSLGKDFDKLKEYTKNFINILKSNSNIDAKIGIVAFSTEINDLPITSNQNEMESYINLLAQGEYTRMYDAMQIAILMIRSMVVDGKAIVTFTDGRDNYSDSTPNDIKQLLKEFQVKSYTVGLKGKGSIEKDILSSLAVNGHFKIANSMNDVNVIFQLFARSISSLYRVTYIRNDQPISNKRDVKFTFIQTENY